MKTDTELVEDFIKVIGVNYQIRVPGYDTWIDRENLMKHLFELCRDLTISEGKIDAIQNITQYD